jgi:hypothetical protein
MNLITLVTLALSAAFTLAAPVEDGTAVAVVSTIAERDAEIAARDDEFGPYSDEGNTDFEVIVRDNVPGPYSDDDANVEASGFEPYSREDLVDRDVKFNDPEDGIDDLVERNIELKTRATTVAGIDVSHYQPNINWSKVAAAGIKFAYMKATEGTSRSPSFPSKYLYLAYFLAAYKDPKFSSHYLGAYKAGIIHGAYHFARPSSSSGIAQANFFLANGGNWSKDGKTLPGMLDLEGEFWVCVLQRICLNKHCDLYSFFIQWTMLGY